MLKPNFKTIPQSPGVYLFKGRSLGSARDKVLYVGKAKNIRSRLKSYFLNSRLAGQPYFAKATKGLRQVSGLINPKIQALLARAEKVEWIETDSEIEALLLEGNLIKEHRPPFNVVLRDDKNYLYLKITLGEDYPRLLFARRIENDKVSPQSFGEAYKKGVFPRSSRALRLRSGQAGPRGGTEGIPKSRFFGPYTSSKDLRRTISLLKRLFPLCSANYVIREKDIKSGKHKKKPCLNYHLGRCLGPCVGEATSAEYKKVISEVIRFLEGDWQGVLLRLEQEMEKAAKEKRFERAAFLRDQKKSLLRLMEEQKVVLPNVKISRDIFGMARALNQVVVAILIVRGGRLLDQKLVAFEDRFQSEEAEVLERALSDYYQRTEGWPKEVVLPTPVGEALQRWLAGKGVKISAPQRGELKKMVGLAARNATNQLFTLSRSLTRENIEEELSALKEILKIKRLSRIEAYDISHLAGTNAVGSMVVFLDGIPALAHYRRFKIKLAKPSDDFGAILEVLKRRFRTRHQAQSTKHDPSFASRPDLVLIDGGKGQLSTALKVIGKPKFKIIALAKKQEEIFLPGIKESIKLKANHPARRLLQRIRDEAHRFAISYHIKLRRKAAIGSILDSIKEVGPTRRRRLIKHFGSLKAAAGAPLEELTKILGDKKLARRLKESLK